MHHNPSASKWRRERGDEGKEKSNQVTRKEFCAFLLDRFDGKAYLTVGDIAKFRGISRERAGQLLREMGVTYSVAGRGCGRRYCVPDVADMLFRLQVRE